MMLAIQTEEDEEPAASKKPKASLASRIQALEMRCVETKESVVFQNGGKYKKLGLFGKGGSCKVFKVLDETPEEIIEQRDLFDRPPSVLKSWATGNVVMIGDAVHPMMPNLGQGGCQAIEDAYVLAQVCMQRR